MYEGLEVKRFSGKSVPPFFQNFSDYLLLNFSPLTPGALYLIITFEYFFSMMSRNMLCFQNCFRISDTNSKVGKTDSMLILKTNIAWNITKLQEFIFALLPPVGDNSTLGNRKQCFTVFKKQSNWLLFVNSFCWNNSAFLISTFCLLLVRSIILLLGTNFLPFFSLLAFYFKS